MVLFGFASNDLQDDKAHSEVLPSSSTLGEDDETSSRRQHRIKLTSSTSSTTSSTRRNIGVAHKETSASSLSAFRDFFLAAFSDGYNSNHHCCSPEGFFPGNCFAGKAEQPQDGGAVGKRKGGSNSNATAFPKGDGTSNSPFDTAGLQASPSYDTNSSSRQQQRRSNNNNASTSNSNSTASQQQQSQRKKPLAIAVGYKYAEDVHGRPVLITPHSPTTTTTTTTPAGSRRSPIDLTKSGSSRSSNMRTNNVQYHGGGGASRPHHSVAA